MILTKICKRVLLTLTILTAASTSARSAGWELVFSDEFNGDKLDRTKWATRYLYQNETMDHFNDENQRYRDGHVVADGVLNLIAKKMPGSVSLYESAMIRSHRTFYYGYYEARVFLPNAKGVWPAFWLEADYDIDGKTWHPPEIDIFEFVINGVEDKANSLHSNVVGPWSAQQYTYVDRSFELKFQNMYGSEDLNQGWHTVGFVWAPDKISLFWDGKLMYTRNYQWLRSDGKLGPPAHVDLNFAVGGSKWAGRHGIDEAAFPQTFKIDYLRVCQYTTSERGGRQCGPSELTPDPKQFGYSAPLNDMAKPAFLGVSKVVAGKRPNAGVLALSTSDKLDVEIPLKIPEDYPSDRTLQLTVYDKATGAIVGSANTKLQVEAGKKRADGSTVAVASLPAVQRPGNYILFGRLTADVPNGSGARQVLPSPVTCSTDVVQPAKATVCKLLYLDVQAQSH
ncbi:glycoside hydrolase family 16 protein [Bradyrhizobium sp. Ash2021]|uniref:glycoside hydrolase family 16 protein n=1 Tax=Bradyrhizobium sp. Ash2021 TaxID=2954771 RepID=UPI002815F1FD|nr:glycoside hydrolase family 16 protein [Bradyrhizobium sp. Ash2021]WMT72897.1 glycoside hydrolase family 16 protein [Bradyrhizobium sp. Ash2021]